MNGDEQLRGRRMRGRHLDRAIRYGDGDHAQEGRGGKGADCAARGRGGVEPLGRGVNSFAATWQVQGVNTHHPDTHRPHQRTDCP
jgi:hypothetical protein